MIPLFIYAAELNLRYKTRGRFYRLCIRGAEVPCRSTLDIIDRNYVVTDKTPDAFFIMMNPGRSRPKAVGENGPCYHLTQTNLAEQIRNTPDVEARPDTTQYQLMRLMIHYGWKFVRVLNLADIRNTKSKEFIIEFTRLQCDYLSMFSDDRDVERLHFLTVDEPRPVIAAWGIMEDLETLSRRAIKKLNCELRGVPGAEKYYYYHPAPRTVDAKKIWLRTFVDTVRF